MVMTANSPGSCGYHESLAIPQVHTPEVISFGSIVSIHVNTSAQLMLEVEVVKGQRSRYSVHDKDCNVHIIRECTSITPDFLPPFLTDNYG